MKLTVSRGYFLTAITALLAACSGGAGRQNGLAGPPKTLTNGSAWSIPATIQGQPILDLNFQQYGEKQRAHAQFLLSPLHNAPSAKRTSRVQSLPTVAPARQGDRFAINRDAGTIVLQNFSTAGVHVGQTGPALFKPNATYSRQLDTLGIPATNAQQIALTLANVSVDDLRSLRAAYPDATVFTMLAIHQMGFSTNEVIALKSGNPDLSAIQALKVLANSKPR